MRALLKKTVEPALLACLKDTMGSTEVFKFVFMGNSLAHGISHPDRLDRDLCRLGKRIDQTLHGTVDTLRTTVRWIAQHEPVRQPTPSERTQKAASRPTKRVWNHTIYVDWPYCEHCKEPSQLAELINKQHGKATAKNISTKRKTTDVSPRFCCKHDPTQNPAAHREAHRHREIFRNVLTAIDREQRIDPRFRQRFIQRAWEMTNIEQAQSSADIYALLFSADPNSVLLNPVDMLAREYAYKIARELPDTRLLSIAKFRFQGFSQAEIAKNLDITRAAVSDRVNRCRGFFDFERQSLLLQWWPDDAVIYRPFVLTSIDVQLKNVR